MARGGELEAAHVESEGQESMTRWLKELYEQVLRGLQGRQQELEASTQQVEGLRNKCNEAKQLQNENVTRMVELEGESQCLSEREANPQRHCECQELDKCQAFDVQH